MEPKSKSLEEKINFIGQIKKFGEEELGIGFKDAFSKYRQTKKFCWLYVTPKYRLESIFKDEYRFYNSAKTAGNEKRFYSARGFDACMYTGEAAGIDTCPITDSLLNAAPERQAFAVLHEGWHITNRSGFYSLEEATGCVIGFMGAISFAEKHLPESKSNAERKARVFKDFSGFIMKYYSMLREAYKGKSYASKRKEKARILAEAEGEKIRFAPNDEMNNAFFYRNHFYCMDYGIALGIYEKVQSLPETARIFREGLKQKDCYEFLEKRLNDWRQPKAALGRAARLQL